MLGKTRKTDNESRISEKAEMKRKFNRDQKRITSKDIQLSSLRFLNIATALIYCQFCETLAQICVKFVTIVVKKKKKKKKNKKKKTERLRYSCKFLLLILNELDRNNSLQFI